MEAGKIVTGFLVFGLFVIALISFGVNFATENNANTLITDNNSAISYIYSNVNDTLHNYNDGTIQENANSSFNSFNQDEGTSGAGSVIGDFFVKTILGVGKLVLGISNALFNATFAPILKAIGIPTGIAKVILGFITTIMLLTMTLLAWKLYRTGI